MVQHEATQKVVEYHPNNLETVGRYRSVTVPGSIIRLNRKAKLLLHKICYKHSSFCSLTSLLYSLVFIFLSHQFFQGAYMYLYLSRCYSNCYSKAVATVRRCYSAVIGGTQIIQLTGGSPCGTVHTYIYRGVLLGTG